MYSLATIPAIFSSASGPGDDMYTMYNDCVHAGSFKVLGPGFFFIIPRKTALKFREEGCALLVHSGSLQHAASMKSTPRVRNLQHLQIRISLRHML